MNLSPELRRLQAEHARWLAELGRVGEEGRAARLLALWDEEIQPHCRLEEDVLLAELAGRLSEADAVIVFTLGDHVALRRLARELRSTPAAGKADAAGRMVRKLADHVAFEEQTVFSAVQEQLGSARLAALGAELGRAGRARPGDEPPARDPGRGGSRKGSKP